MVGDGVGSPLTLGCPSLDSRIVWFGLTDRKIFDGRTKKGVINKKQLFIFDMYNYYVLYYKTLCICNT